MVLITKIKSIGKFIFLFPILLLKAPGPVARLDANPPDMQTIARSILGCGNNNSWRLVMESFLITETSPCKSDPKFAPII